MSTLSGTLATRRHELGQSQEQAGVYCGTTRQTYAKWEADRDFPRTFERVPDISHWLGIGPEDVALMILEAQERANLRGAQDGTNPGYFTLHNSHQINDAALPAAA